MRLRIYVEKKTSHKEYWENTNSYNLDDLKNPLINEFGVPVLKPDLAAFLLNDDAFNLLNNKNAIFNHSLNAIEFRNDFPDDLTDATKGQLADEKDIVFKNYAYFGEIRKWVLDNPTVKCNGYIDKISSEFLNKYGIAPLPEAVSSKYDEEHELTNQAEWSAPIREIQRFYNRLKKLVLTQMPWIEESEMSKVENNFRIIYFLERSA